MHISGIMATTPLTLEESIDLALENNKELLAEEQGYEAAKWAQHNVLSNFFPQASFNARAVRIDDETYNRATEVHKIPVFGPNNIPTGDYIPFSAASMNGLYRTTYNTGFTVQQPIFNGGKIFLGYQIARLARKQAEQTVTERENDIRHRVADTYLNILKMQDLSETVDKNITSASANLHNVSHMKELGMAKESDVLQWQVRLQEYRTTQREIDYTIEILLEHWNSMLGYPEILYHPEAIDLANYDEEISQYAAFDRAEIEDFVADNVESLKRYNPQIQNIELTRDIVRKNYSMAKGNFLPSLNLQFSYELENDDKLDLSGDSNWNLAAVLSFPLFKGGANYTNLRKVRAEKRQTDLATSAMEDYYIIETRRVSKQLITNALQVESNQTGLEYARENYYILRNLFEQGMLTSSEFLDAETMLFVAESNVISAYYDFIIAIYELNKYRTLKGDR
jgi:outer membrane protein TolC